MIPFSISIHAPREGCDACPVTWSAAQRRISIHAPREGCDGRRPDRRPSSPDFNPRTPRGVRPLNHPHQGAVLDISIHAPREGCDQRGVDRRSTVIQFQSTHPARGATDHKRPSGFLYVISIHAPREGCDQSAMRSTVRDMAHFNPRTTRGVRPVVAPIKWYGCRNFNPRTPRGVRLRSRFALPRYAQISIHAPREGCDVSPFTRTTVGAGISIHAPREGCDPISSTVMVGASFISIHAPREGCDSKLYQRAESLLGSICLFAQGEEG